VSFEDGWLFVNGSWVTPRRQDGRGHRKAVKNRVLHEVPLPQTLLINELLPRVKELLHLPESASLQQVIHAQQAERDRRTDTARELGDPTIHWYNLPVEPADELWVFVDTATGVPTPASSIEPVARLHQQEPGWSRPPARGCSSEAAKQGRHRLPR